MIVTSATAIALGTYTGGWRIIRTMGTKIIKMDTAQGFSAQGAGAATILASTHFGFPLSTTQVIAGGVMGAGAGKRVSAVRWGVAGNLVIAWVLTLPAAAAIGAAAYGFTSIFGDGAARPAARLACWRSASGSALFAQRIRRGQPVPASVIAMLLATDRRRGGAARHRCSPSLVAGVGITLAASTGDLRLRDVRRGAPRRPDVAAAGAARSPWLAASPSSAAIAVGLIVHDQRLSRIRRGSAAHRHAARRLRC